MVEEGVEGVFEGGDGEVKKLSDYEIQHSGRLSFLRRQESIIKKTSTLQ